jgi:hypothetical protein
MRAFLAELFGHEPDLLRRIDPLIELAVAIKPVVESTLAEVERVAAGDDDLVRLFKWAEQIADASNGRNEREAALLARIANEWQIAADAPVPAASDPEPSTTSRPTSPTTDPRSELGIPADAEITVELVGRRYNVIVDQFDAVKLEGLGVEFTRLAALKRGNAEAAALALLKPLGATLTPPVPPPPAELRHNPDLDAVFGA